MRDLLQQLMQLNEAPVKPGERKEISFKLKKLEKMSSNLDAYKRSLYNMAGSALPPELQKDMDALQEKLGNEISKVQAAYDQVYEKSIAASGRPIKMDNVFKAIAKNCKQIIKVYKELNRNNFNKQRFMYRGIRSSSDALYGKPFDARKPKDSNRDLHELVNGTIKNLGFEANRENAMFMTGDRSQASGYGHSLYVMFPVDGFTYTWSREEKDLVLDNSKRMQLIDREVADQIRGAVRLAKEKDSTIPISYPGDLFTSGYDYDSDVAKVSSAIQLGLLPDEVKTLLDDLLTDTSIQEYFKFTNNDLFEAILSNKEIYVRGDYYAVNTNHMKELVDFLKDVDVDSVELPESFGEVPNILEPGDIVKILSGPYEGRLATITYAYTNTYEVQIQQGEETSVSKDQVEIYKLPDGSTPNFTDRQKVIVTNPDSHLYGDTLTITYMYSSGKLDATDEEGNSHELWVSELSDYNPELAKELAGKPKAHKFKTNEYAKVLDSNSDYYDKIGRVSYLYSSGKVELTFPGGAERVFARNQLELVAEPKQDTPVTGDQESFNVQDKVVIVNHPKSYLNGKTGKVDYVYQNHPEVAVIFDDDELGLEDINVANVKKVEDTTDTSTTDTVFKVGDIVKVISDESSYYGQTGQVLEVGKNPDGKEWVKFKSPTLTGGVKTFIDWVEKVTDQVEFKLGDKVKIDHKQSLYNGEEGTVTAGPDEDGDYKVQVGNKITYVPPGGLQKIQDTPVTFNIGDKVKITDKSSGFFGSVGQIESGPDDDGDYSVMFNEDDAEWAYFRIDDMEKVEEPKAAATFSEGDTVKITGPSAYNNSSFIGYTGTITSVSDDGKFAGVRVEDGTEDTILTYETTNLSKSTADEIDNLTWEPEPEAKAPLKVGNTVKNIKDGHPHFGKTAEVKTTYSSGNVGLVYSDGSQAIDPAKWLEKVQVPVQAEAPKFEVNDRVEVVSQFPGLIGMKGKITQVSPNYDFVSVWIDGNTAASSFPTSALKKVDANDPTEFHLGDMVEVTNSELSSYGKKGKVTDMDVSMLVVQDSDDGDVFFAKKANVKKIG